MTERLDDVWISRDYPVLREVTRRMDERQQLVNVDTVAAATGLTADQVRQAGNALERRGLVKVAGSLSGPVGFLNDAVTRYGDEWISTSAAAAPSTT